MRLSSTQLLAAVLAVIMVTSVMAAPIAAPSTNIPHTRDEIAQQKYGQEFAELSDDTADAVEEIYDRQPFAQGVSLSDVQTRDELAQAEHEIGEFEDLSDQTKRAIEREYEAQFAGGEQAYTRDEIAQAKYNEDFEDLSDVTTPKVEEKYDRQPFVSFDRTQEPADILTRDEIAQKKYNTPFEALSNETKLEVEDLYDQQFPLTVVEDGRPPGDGDGPPGDGDGPPDDGDDGDDGDDDDGVASFEIVSITNPTVEQGETAEVTATIENTGNGSGERTIRLVAENGSGPESTELELDAGASQNVTFEVDTSDLKPGTWAYICETGDDTATSVVTVRAPSDGDGAANFQVASVDAPRVQRGETSNITATIENTGDAAGTQNVSLLVEGENISVGTGAADIVFVIDDSGTMGDDIDTVQRELSAFAQRLQNAGVRAEYAVVTNTDSVVVQQEFIADVDQTNETLERIRIGGTEEYNYDGIQQGLDLDGRENAKRVIIDLTDEDTDLRAGSPTQQQLANRMNRTNTTFIAVTPTSDNLENPSDGPEFEKRPLANLTESGQWYDLQGGDYGDEFRTGVAETIINVTQERERKLSLDAGESAQVAFPTDTSDLPPARYDVTVATANDSETTTLRVRAPPSGQPQFELVQVTGGTPQELPREFPLEARVTVRNIGNTSGTSPPISLVMNNSTTTIFDSESEDGLDLDAGESEDFRFTIHERPSVGVYNLTATLDGQTETGELIVASASQPTLRTASIDAPDTEQGETANITAQMVNVHDLEGTGLITLIIEDAGIDRTIEEEFFRLEAKPVSFEVDTSDLDPGSYTVIIETNLGRERATLNVTEPSDGGPTGEASFEVASVTNPEVEQGETATVTATIENTGDEAGTRTINIVAEQGSAPASTELSLDAGESDNVTFEIDTSDLVAGEWAYTIETGDDTATSVVTVTDAPGTATFEFDGAGGADFPVNGGGTLAATVENTGDASGSQTVTVTASNATTTIFEAERLVDLDAGESTRLRFQLGGLDASPGTYNVSYATEADTAEATLTIREPSRGGGNGGPPASTFELGDVFGASGNQGETVSTSADVENTGQTAGVQTVRLNFANDSAFDDQEQTVSLGPGQRERVTFNVSLDGVSPGEYRATYETANDSRDIGVNVLVPDASTFTITRLEAPDTAQGRTADVTMFVNNIDGGDGTGDVTLRVEGTDIEQTQSLTIPGLEELPTTFEVDTSDLEPGTYTVVIETNFETETTTLNVTESPEGGFDTPTFEVTDFVHNDSWLRDDIHQLSTTITNTGNATGTQTVTFTQVNETTTITSDEVELTLDPGEEEEVFFPVETQDVALGNYTLTVETENDSVARNFELISGPI